MGRLVVGVNDLYTWCLENVEWGKQLLNEWVGLDEFGNKVYIHKISRSEGRKRVCWKCKEGHEWLAAINNRVLHKTKCPYCSGARVSDKNNLENWCKNNGELGQQIQQEWTGLDENNKPIEITEVSFGSNKKVQWKCKEGHTWITKVNIRTSERGCPYCSGQRVSDKNSFKIWCEQNGEWGQQLLKEWTGSDETNTPIEINAISYTSDKKVHWKCKEGHQWTAVMHSRTRQKQGCPYCSGRRVSDKNSLKTWCIENGEYGQQLLQEWTGIDENNNPIEIDKISRANSKKVHWKCKEGHQWTATIKNRTLHKSECPYCTGKKVSDKNSLEVWCQNNGVFGQLLLQEWTGLDEIGNHINMHEVSYGSDKKVQWKCNKQHIWYTTIKSRTGQKSGCTYCTPYNTSFPEQFIYYSLKQIYENAISRGKYRGYEYDITIPKLRLCIEYSGFNWHKDKLDRDEEKKQLCKKHGVNFLQIYAHHGEIQDTEGNIANDSYTKKQIIYRVNNNNKDLHIVQLQVIVKFILEKYDPEHTISEINFVKAELEANEIIQGINSKGLGEESTDE